VFVTATTEPADVVAAFPVISLLISTDENAPTDVVVDGPATLTDILADVTAPTDDEEEEPVVLRLMPGVVTPGVVVTDWAGTIDKGV
jgi:hypothetical protein